MGWLWLWLTRTRVELVVGGFLELNQLRFWLQSKLVTVLGHGNHCGYRASADRFAKMIMVVVVVVVHIVARYTMEQEPWA